MRLLCAISHHGLGHLAQSAPVLHALNALRPGIDWLIWSGLTRAALEARLDFSFTHRHEAADVGLLMQDAVRVDTPASLRALTAFHQDWPGRVAHEADWLRAQGLAGVLSNAAYLPLAAAARAGLPAVGFCSLNWWDIARRYLAGHARAVPLLAQMQAAYLDATAFLELTPGMRMAWLPRVQIMPPVAALGVRRREALTRRLELDANMKCVLVGLGGVAYHPPAPLPALPGVAWLVPPGWPESGRQDMRVFATAGMSFADVLASCDALVTKVGYGSFVEAAGLGVPVLYLDRPDWPETPWLAAWLTHHARAAAIDEGLLFTPEVGVALQRLWHSPAPTPPNVAGAKLIARRVLEVLA